MNKIIYAIVFVLFLSGSGSAEPLTINRIEGIGNFDSTDCRDSLICFMTMPEVMAVTNWVPRDAVGLTDEEIRKSLRVNLSFRYGTGISTQGTSGSGGLWRLSTTGTSVSERQEGVLYLRVMVYAPGNLVAHGFQVEARDGEQYPLYSQVGISTPYFNFEKWGWSNKQQLAELVGEQRMIAVATSKALVGLASWWLSPPAMEYRLSARQLPQVQSRPGIDQSPMIVSPGQALGGPPQYGEQGQEFQTQLTTKQLAGARQATALEVYHQGTDGTRQTKISGIRFRIQGSSVIYCLPWPLEEGDGLRFYK